MRIDQAAYQRVLGDELRRLRRQRGWTRKVLQGKLQTEVSLQTLATYELGTRQCSVVRLAELCLALETTPQDLLAKVHSRIFHETSDDYFRFALRKVIADDQPELLPLRRWAQDRLKTSNDSSTDIGVSLLALDHMAALCGLTREELIARLQALAG